MTLVVNPRQVEPDIDDEAFYKAIGFKPHSDLQGDITRSKARFNIPCCGRRFGKSLGAGHRATKKAFTPGMYNWIVGPTYKLGEKEFRVVWHDFEVLGILKDCKKSYDVKGGNMRIETPWKSIIEVVSAEKPDSLLGEGLYHVIMSEAAKHRRDTWEQYIEPALSDLRGSADFPSTPQGYNWYYGLWMLGQDPTMVEYASWTAPTWANTVMYPGGYDDPEIQRVRANTPKAKFDQEYGARFTSFEGQIYDEFDKRIHVADFTFNPAWSNYLAFDYGYANPFVCLDIQIDPEDNVWVWREYYSRFRSTQANGTTLKERDNPEHYHIQGMWGDPRGANEAATLGPLMGYVASDATITWKQGVDAIKGLLKDEKLHISTACPNLIRQIEQLHVKERVRAIQELDERGGEVNIQHKVDDHAADALRYFIGPYFVKGAGSHLSDVYGQDLETSEANEFFTMRTGVTLTGGITL